MHDIKGVGALVVLLSLCVGSLEARSWQSHHFLESLAQKEPEINLPFIHQGLNSVHRVRFKPGATNQYRPLLNHIIFGERKGDGARRLLPIDELNPTQVGTIAHEAFHAYVTNFIQRSEILRDQYEWIKFRANNLYRGEGLARQDRLIALEEAYAVFIGKMISMFVSLKSSFQRREQCDRSRQQIEDLWEVNWESEVHGYYYEDGPIDYWKQQIQGLWDRLRGERPEAHHGPIFVETALNSVDRQWITDKVFRGRLSEDPEETFRSLGCHPKEIEK